MQIKEILVRNFRLLKNTCIKVEKGLSLLVGKNNTGKTSLLVIFQKFFENKPFTFYDFSISTRQLLLSSSAETDFSIFNIQLKIDIEYGEEDDLSSLSELMTDLDPEERVVRVLLENEINKSKFLSDLQEIEGDEKNKWIERNVSNYFRKSFFTINTEKDFIENNREGFVSKEISHLKDVMNVQIIHAKRDVSSSEASMGEKKILSVLTTKFFNRMSKEKSATFNEINKLIEKMDNDLGSSYEELFKDFLSNARDFVDSMDLRVISDLKANQIVDNSSKVIYGIDEQKLPEHLNGLGYMNILYLLLAIEMKKEDFITAKRNINLLFIEEPEAHTHPHMQYVFSEKIEDVLSGIKGLQTLITTHSSQIVSRADFKNLRYISKVNDGEYDNVKVKNFHTELQEKYSDVEQFKFIEKYLSLQSSELFFATKVILIEGITEKILLPYFIREIDRDSGTGQEVLSSQNISILEVGANAKAFQIFLDFLNVKTLIITDFDSVKAEKVDGKDETRNIACDPREGENTSNQTLRHFFGYPADPTHDDIKGWYEKLCEHTLDCVSESVRVEYQIVENGYQARSFEDSFLCSNLDKIKENKDGLWGLKNIKLLDEDTNLYNLTDRIIGKKSDFASSLLFLALTKDIEWNIPKYIKAGLEWLRS